MRSLRFVSFRIRLNDRLHAVVMSAPLGPHYRVGIIGCGSVADKIEDAARGAPGYLLFPASHASIYERHPRTTLVAAADTNPDRLAAFGKRHGITALYNDHREMMDRESLDIVSIATNTSSHREVTLDVARHSVKGIFLEKPVAHALGEADEMLAATTAAGISVVVNHYRTFDPYFRAAFKLIHDGQIGELEGVMATWVEGFAQGAPHLWDLLRVATGSHVAWVSCHLDEDPALLDPGGDAYLVYKSGVRVHVHAPRASATPTSITFIGGDGFVRMGAFRPEFWRFERSGERRIPVEWPFPGRHDGKSGMYAALEELVAAMESGQRPASTLADGREALEVTIALLIAGRSAARVPLPIVDTDYIAESYL